MCQRFGAFATALLGYFIGRTLAVPTVQVKGSKFFTSEGKQFYIKGVAYAEPSDSDTMIDRFNSLVDADACERDAQIIADLGANVIRPYSVDPTLNHDACMSAFEKKGIYVIVDVPSPTISINRLTPEWTISMRDEFMKVIDGFSKYDNLLAFVASNEVITNVNNTKAAPYVRAAIADLKAYRDLQGYRNIPIGYSDAFDASVREETLNYFNCGDQESAADFFAANVYTWCNDDDTMAKTGYDSLYKEIEGYSIPYFFSETGCNQGGSRSKGPNRSFKDQAAVLGREMNDRLSGNIIYEYFQNVNNYGLVSVSGTSVSKFSDYSRLQQAWKTLSPDGVKSEDYSPTLTARSCPTSRSGSWEVNANAELPTLGLSGVTTPSAPRYTSTVYPGASGSSLSSGGPTDSNKENSPATNKPNSSQGESSGSSPGLSVGAIAGIVIGVLVVVGLILSFTLLCLWRKRKIRKLNEGLKAASGPLNPESDKIAVASEDPDERKTSSYYGSSYAELEPQHRAAELDPSRGYAAPLPANELSTQGPLGYSELPPGGDTSQVYMAPPVQNQTQTAPEPSPHVQRQREIEMNWLESEEARIRQRRELLRQQGGGN
ncbi:glycoside hydrolase family 72 protein [Aaosphaeria arxii CBS 175.79]|uniref:1,3-beta-glucanosyltransferase n=1 Tax=Aaosphaeria arxii CBS 175.79 TaxID=1450172 RepID=A0A6A5Y8L3_9PLEO|nr:glycoside hydrolase family 72 protein [Aaosphaeria arxii CBS 175.79]KAF2021081.1 glycoside hydrolase family 72 protein [Aaosphaeria arxii CBS 175.79]